MTDPRPRGLPVDADQWSEASKQSAEFGSPPEEYVDIPYTCWRCGAPSIFSAEDQKYTFEVRKAYVWQRRILCTSCWRERTAIEAQILECSDRWSRQESSQPLRQDRDFVNRWLKLLEDLPKYGGKRNDALIGMLSRLH